jgi:hypothetical protein
LLEGALLGANGSSADADYEDSEEY